MTLRLLDCQKRHHESHLVWDGLFWTLCDGLPRWPHNRPKPPPINSGDYINYLKHHNPIAVWKTGRTEWSTEWVGDFRTFPTHTEAIFYAHTLAKQ